MQNAELHNYVDSIDGYLFFFLMKGQSSSTAENAVGDLCKTRIPSTALALNSFHAVSYYSKVIPSYDAAAVANQNISIHLPSAVPKVSKFIPQHCNSVLDQTCTTHSNGLVSIQGLLDQTGLSQNVLQFVKTWDGKAV